MAKKDCCVAHLYRPAKSHCKSCGKGICEECERVHASLCPSCANIPGGNSARPRPSPKNTAPEKSDRGGLPQVHSLRLPPDVKGKARIAGAVVLILAFLTLIVLGAKGLGPFPFRPKKLGSTEAQQFLRQNLYTVATAIDAFKKRTGSLPKGLDEIGMGQDPSVSYQAVSNDRYILSQTKFGKTVSYDSSVEARVYFADLAAPINPSAGQGESSSAK